MADVGVGCVQVNTVLAKQITTYGKGIASLLYCSLQLTACLHFRKV